MNILTYNICSGRNFLTSPNRVHAECKFDLTGCGEVIKKYKPDIVGLNEVRGKGEHANYTAQAQFLGEYTGMNYFFAPAIRFDGVDPYGNALLSKYPIESAEAVIIPDPEIQDEDEYYETRCVLSAVINADGKRIRVLVSHFGLPNSEKRSAVATVVKLAESETLPLIFMGDLNMTPDDEKLKPIFTIFGEPLGVIPTFPSEAPEIKIDYIFAKNGAKVVKTAPLNELTSDHKPFSAVIEIK